MRTIYIGDVHGCLDQLDELLRQVEPGPRDRLVFLGDLMDKGPDPVGVVRRVRELGAPCVMGNHDEKHVRWRRHEAVRRDTGKPNPMRPMDPVSLAQNEALSDADVEWMSSLPAVLRTETFTVAVHGGFEPRLPLAKQDLKKVLRCRYVDAEGAMVPIMSDTHVPDGTVRWAQAFREPVHVFYGHHCLTLDEAQVDVYEDPIRWFRAGIDGGCAYGGSLIAAVESYANMLEFVKVKGEAYATLWEGDS